jgi:acyl-CoA reductase-like NAD-dependent aldehyde dehydrogenase
MTGNVVNLDVCRDQSYLEQTARAHSIWQQQHPRVRAVQVVLFATRLSENRTHLINLLREHVGRGSRYDHRRTVDGLVGLCSSAIDYARRMDQFTAKICLTDIKVRVTNDVVLFPTDFPLALVTGSALVWKPSLRGATLAMTVQELFEDAYEEFKASSGVSAPGLLQVV